MNEGLIANGGKGSKGGGGSAAKAGIVGNDGATGRFVGNVGLTQMQSDYVSAFISNGGNQRAAAKVAGYSSPESVGWYLSRHPAVVAEIRTRQLAQLGGLAVVGIQTLRAVMQDETAPAAARVQASRFALEAAGFGIQAEALKLRFAGIGDEKDLSAMSIPELQRLALMVKAEVDEIADRQTAPSRSDTAPIALDADAYLVDSEDVT